MFGKYTSKTVIIGACVVSAVIIGVGVLMPPVNVDVEPVVVEPNISFDRVLSAADSAVAADDAYGFAEEALTATDTATNEAALAVNTAEAVIEPEPEEVTDNALESNTPPAVIVDSTGDDGNS